MMAPTGVSRIERPIHRMAWPNNLRAPTALVANPPPITPRDFVKPASPESLPRAALAPIIDLIDEKTAPDILIKPINDLPRLIT